MRRFTLATVVLGTIVAFLVGVILARGVSRSTVGAGAPGKTVATRPASRASASTGPTPLINFADVVDHIKPAVANIDATTSGRTGANRRRNRAGIPVPPDPFDRDAPPRGAGSGFIIDTDGRILTNNHVVDRAGLQPYDVSGSSGPFASRIDEPDPIGSGLRT